MTTLPRNFILLLLLSAIVFANEQVVYILSYYFIVAIFLQAKSRSLSWNSGPLIGPYSGAIAVPPDIVVTKH